MDSTDTEVQVVEATPEDETVSFRDTVSKFEASRFMIRSASPGKFSSVRETSFSENPDEEPVTGVVEYEEQVIVKSPLNSPRRPTDLPPPAPEDPPPDDDDYPPPASPEFDLPPAALPKPILKKPKKPSKLAPPKPKPKGVWFNMTDQYPVENFSGRLAILQQLETLVTSPKSRDVRPISMAIILAGRKGIGKTEIARKFAFRFYVEASGNGNVVWLDATSKDSIRGGLSTLYEKEFVPATPDPEGLSKDGIGTDAGSKGASVLPEKLAAPEAGKSFLRNPKPTKPLLKSPKSGTKKVAPPTVDEEIESLLTMKTFQHHPSLFIFDNARCEEDILEFLPKLSPIGFIPSVLVTTRNKNWNSSRVIHVEEMEFSEAVDFLDENLKQYPEFRRYQGEDLAKDLHRFPPLLQRARRIVSNYVDSIGSERALLRLEKNIGLVRRLKHEAPFSRDVEDALLAVDRGVFYEEDSYIREFDGDLRNHAIMMTIRQLEILAPVLNSFTGGVILTVNEDPYTLAMLAYLMDKGTTIAALYDSNNRSQSELNEMQTLLDRHDPSLLKSNRIQILNAQAVKAKPGNTKISPLLEKIRSQNPKKQYDVIFTATYDDDDISQVRKLLTSGGFFVTSTTSANTTVLLKKNDSKKSEMKILKQEFPQLLLTIKKL